MAKYNLENTTIGEMLDTPELKALIEKYIPDVLDHPLLEVGRSFAFEDALPYFEDMIDEEDLEKFKAALAEIE